MCGRFWTSSVALAGDWGTREATSYGARGWFFLEPGTGAQYWAESLGKRSAGIWLDSVDRVACRKAEIVWRESLGGPCFQVEEIQAAETLT